MINKQKMGKEAGQGNEPIRGSKKAPTNTGPDSYDGRANTNAGTPSPQTAAEGPAEKLQTEE